MIIGFLVVCFSASCFLLWWGMQKYNRDQAIFIGLPILVVSFIFLVVWPMQYFSEISNIQYFKSVQQTAERGRSGDQYLEGAAFRLEIAECNGWLAKAQYWNDTIFDPYIPDEVDSLKPIE